MSTEDLYLCLRDQLIRNPEAWTVTRYRATHAASGIVLWVANGWLFLNDDQDSRHSLALPLYYRWKLWPYVRAMLNHKAGVALETRAA